MTGSNDYKTGIETMETLDDALLLTEGRKTAEEVELAAFDLPDKHRKPLITTTTTLSGALQTAVHNSHRAGVLLFIRIPLDNARIGATTVIDSLGR